MDSGVQYSLLINGAKHDQEGLWFFFVMNRKFNIVVVSIGF